MAADERARDRVTSTLENSGLWVLGHASRLWPFVVVLAVLGLTWSGVRQFRPRDFSAAIRALDVTWLFLAGLVTVEAGVLSWGSHDAVLEVTAHDEAGTLLAAYDPRGDGAAIGW